MRQQLVLVTSVALVLMTPPAQAQKETSPKLPVSERAALTEAKWLTQASPLPAAGKEQVALITAIQLKPTSRGLEVILETTGTFDEVLTSSSENSLITDIPNAQLRLPVGREFQRDNPTDAITTVRVENLDTKTIRVTVTGKAGVPTAEVSQSPQALILSVAAPPAPVAPPATPAQPTPAPTPPPAAPAPAPEPKPQAEKDLLQLEVRAEEEAGGYNVPDASVGTRTDTPIRDIPQSIQVIPRQVLEDQGITQIGDALRNVSGIGQPRTTNPVTGDFVTIRGFDPGRAYFVNGLRSPFGGFNINLETENIEQIEVLKGPASVLYGQIEPGGIINLTTRQPLSDPYYNFGGIIGNFDFYRPTFDISGPLNSEETILYRLTGAYQNSGSFVDFIDLERYFVAPVLSLQLGENTRLAVEGQYLDQSGIAFNGLPASGTILPNPLGELPRDRFLGDPEAGGLQDRNLFSIGYRLDHEFNQDWSIRNAFRFDSLYSDEQYIFFTGLEDDNRTLNREVGAAEYTRENYTLQTDVIGAFNTGTVEHDVVFGVELRRFTEAGEYSSASVDPIDIFDPVYGVSPGEFTLSSDSVTQLNLVGVYAQDLVSITDNLKILLGGRFDFVDLQTDDAVSGDSFGQQDTVDLLRKYFLTNSIA